MAVLAEVFCRKSIFLWSFLFLLLFFVFSNVPVRKYGNGLEFYVTRVARDRATVRGVEFLLYFVAPM